MDRENKVIEYFLEICKIPHGSNNEKELSDYIVSFAKKRGYKVVQDAMYNVVVTMESTLEDKEDDPIILQAHLDMVCQKTSDSHHDFENDPIEVIEKEGYFYANNTTLGADDGLGVACMMALMDSNFIHPTLSLVFTVQEETGLYGAKGINPELLIGHRFISLDGCEFGVTETTSSGGRDFILKRNLTPLVNLKKAIKITIHGLLGGHSGEEINKERANANVLMGRLLKHLIDEHIRYTICAFEGGDKANAISLKSEVILSTNENIQDIIEDFEKIIQEEYRFSDPHIHIDYENIDYTQTYSKEDTWNIVNLIYLAPHSVIEYSTEITHFPLTSLNLGVLTIQNNCIELVFGIRSTLKSKRDYLSGNLRTLAYLFDFDCFEEGEFDGWPYDKNSLLRKQLTVSWKKMFNQDIVLKATHGGLETALFKAHKPDLDIITLGANAYDIHTPNEHLDIQSLKNLYLFLLQFLGEIA